MAGVSFAPVARRARILCVQPRLSFPVGAGRAHRAGEQRDGQPRQHAVVTASDDATARVWDAATGAVLSHFAQHEERVATAAFSPDGARVVTASFDRTARIWDAASGAALATISGHTGWVNGAAFSTDGTRVVTASFDGTARIVDAKPG